jgi:hypothetical protein
VSKRLTIAHLSAIAQQIPGDPSVDDWGVPAAVIARCEAVVSDMAVYQGARAQAAAAFHTLIRLPMLEHSNARFAALAAMDLLEYHSITAPADWSAWAKLATAVHAGTGSVRDVHETIITWTT